MKKYLDTNRQESPTLKTDVKETKQASEMTRIFLIKIFWMISIVHHFEMVCKV